MWGIDQELAEVPGIVGIRHVDGRRGSNVADDMSSFCEPSYSSRPQSKGKPA
jgi:hypothetical protein